jgi:hypothetical protein
MPSDTTDGADEPAIAELEDGVAFDLPPDVTARIESLASAFVASLVTAPIGSPSFGRAIRAIDGLGEREIAATTQIAARFQDRPVRVLEEVLAERAPLSRHVRELERWPRRWRRGSRPGDGPTGTRTTWTRTTGARPSGVRELIPELEADRALLELDNAGLAQQEQALWREIETLRQYAALAARLDQLLPTTSRRSRRSTRAGPVCCASTCSMRRAGDAATCSFTSRSRPRATRRCASSSRTTSRSSGRCERRRPRP